jgi:hypothetical protein
VRQHDRVVVDVDDAGFGRNRLSDLMGVVLRRQPGTDIKELPDPGLLREVAHRGGEKRPVRPNAGQDVRVDLERGLCGLPVGGEVILAAQPVVLDTRRVCHADIDLRDGVVLAPSATTLCHHLPSVIACPLPRSPDAKTRIPA